MVHNTTDGSHGYVVALSSATAVVTALFYGTDNDWTNGDAYIINPQHRYEIYLDPPPSTNGHSIYVPYVKRPAPVFSAYRFYTFPSGYDNVLVHYAAWLYKYRDKEPSYGDGFYKYWDYQCSILEQAVKGAKVTDWSYPNRIIMDNAKKTTTNQKGE
jgi:hypothetical protein